MTKILLLDDSAIIQKVVRVALGELPGYELVVVRHPNEWNEALLSAQAHWVVLAYVRFFGPNPDPAHFVDLRQTLESALARGNGSHVPLVIVTESNEDVTAFQALGFHNFLRKPFTTGQLTQILLELVPGGSEASVFSEDDEPTQAVLMASLKTPPASPSAAPSPHAAPVHAVDVGHLRQQDASPSLGSVSLGEAQAPEVSLHPYVHQGAKLNWDSQFSEPSYSPVTGAHSAPQGESPDLPPLTLDLDLLEQGFRAASSKHELPPPPRGLATPPSAPVGLELSPLAARDMFEIEDRKTSIPPKNQGAEGHPWSDGQHQRPFAPARTEREPRTDGEQSLSRGEMQALIQTEVDDALMRALNRAVPAKIEALLDARWAELVKNVGERVRIAESSGILQNVKETVFPLLIQETRDMVSLWIEAQALEMARGIVSAELKNLMQDSPL